MFSYWVYFQEFEDIQPQVRSSVYAPSLRYLNLEYARGVDDDPLGTIVAVCRGTLQIKDYYAMDVEPKFYSMRNGVLQNIL